MLQVVMVEHPVVLTGRMAVSTQWGRVAVPLTWQAFLLVQLLRQPQDTVVQFQWVRLPAVRLAIRAMSARFLHAVLLPGRRGHI